MGNFYEDRLAKFYSHCYSQNMKTVSKNVLKAKMLEYFREVERTGEELIVTDHKKPVLKIVPFKHKKSVDELFAESRGRVIYFEDIRTPTTDEWSET